VLISQFAQYVEIWQRDPQNAEAWPYRHYGPGEVVELRSIGLVVHIDVFYRGLVFHTDGESDEE
jgi:hypothetical protein